MRQEVCNHFLLEAPLATEPAFPTIRLNVSVTFTPSKITPCNNVPLQKVITAHLTNQKITDIHRTRRITTVRISSSVIIPNQSTEAPPPKFRGTTEEQMTVKYVCAARTQDLHLEWLPGSSLCCFLQPRVPSALSIPKIVSAEFKKKKKLPSFLNLLLGWQYSPDHW